MSTVKLQQYISWQDTGKYDTSKISFYNNQNVSELISSDSAIGISNFFILNASNLWNKPEISHSLSPANLQCLIFEMSLSEIIHHSDRLHTSLYIMSCRNGILSVNMLRTSLRRGSQVRWTTFVFLHWAHVSYWFIWATTCLPYFCVWTRRISNQIWRIIVWLTGCVWTDTKYAGCMCVITPLCNRDARDTL